MDEAARHEFREYESTRQAALLRGRDLSAAPEVGQRHAVRYGRCNYPRGPAAYAVLNLAPTANQGV